jgi:hypothetical protein
MAMIFPCVHLTRRQLLVVTTIVVLVLGLGFLMIEHMTMGLRIAFADEQTAIFEQMRRQTAESASVDVRSLEYALNYYPSGTKQTPGTSLDRIVERARQTAIREIIAILRTRTGQDFGDDPRAWIDGLRAESRTPTETGAAIVVPAQVQGGGSSCTPRLERKVPESCQGTPDEELLQEAESQGGIVQTDARPFRVPDQVQDLAETVRAAALTSPPGTVCWSFMNLCSWRAEDRPAKKAPRVRPRAATAGLFAFPCVVASLPDTGRTDVPSRSPACPCLIPARLPARAVAGSGAGRGRSPRTGHA